MTSDFNFTQPEASRRLTGPRGVVYLRMIMESNRLRHDYLFIHSDRLKVCNVG